ncbi:MAG: exodeoxyribonuclease V subunit gamma [Opitutales bacterium]|nr:exodeoxyribonuclease V subunit gamma [Opitutales bacterium]
MRSIPAKRICLLGMNHEQFPRRPNQLPFDLLVSQPRRGDRNPKEEDKQHFLETLLSVRDGLFISYQGISPVNENPKEPSNVVSLLMDYLDTASCASRNASRVVKHKRQSYDPDYFSNSTLFTYSDSRARNTLSYLRSSNQGLSPTTSEKRALQIEETDLRTVSIDSLIRFYKDPSRFFIQSVAGGRFVEREERWLEADRIRQDPLDRYQIRKLFAEAIQSGRTIDSVRPALISALKLLPPGHLGNFAFDSIREQARLIDSLWATSKSIRPGFFEYFDLAIGTYRLHGQLRLNANQDFNYILVPGKLNGRARIETWIRHLLVNSMRSVETRVYSLDESESTLAYSPPDNPSDLLQDLMETFWSGQTQPIPLKTQTSWDAFTKVSKNQSPTEGLPFIEAFCSQSQSLLEQAEDSEVLRSGSTWTQYDRACFGESPPFNSDYGKLALKIWQPYTEHLGSL